MGVSFPQTRELKGNSLGNQERIHGAPIQLIHEWERSHPVIRRMDASITNNCLPSVLQHTTRPTDFLTGTQ